MERSKTRTGLIIAVVALAVIVVVALMMHYANTGRLFPSMNEVKRDATEAGERITESAERAANNAKTGAATGNSAKYTVPQPTITHYPETQIIR